MDEMNQRDLVAFLLWERVSNAWQYLKSLPPGTEKYRAARGEWQECFDTYNSYRKKEYRKALDALHALLENTEDDIIGVSAALTEAEDGGSGYPANDNAGLSKAELSEHLELLYAYRGSLKLGLRRLRSRIRYRDKKK